MRPGPRRCNASRFGRCPLFKSGLGLVPFLDSGVSLAPVLLLRPLHRPRLGGSSVLQFLCQQLVVPRIRDHVSRLGATTSRPRRPRLESLRLQRIGTSGLHPSRRRRVHAVQPTRGADESLGFEGAFRCRSPGNSTELPAADTLELDAHRSHLTFRKCLRCSIASASDNSDVQRLAEPPRVDPQRPRYRGRSIVAVPSSRCRRSTRQSSTANRSATPPSPTSSAIDAMNASR